MDRQVPSCESTAPSVSPFPLRGGRRSSKIEEDIYVYKLCATVIWAFYALAHAGISIDEKEQLEIVRTLKGLLGSERVLAEASECPDTCVAGNAHWNPGLDRIFVDAMLAHQSSWAGGTFTVSGWQMIVTRFNHISCLNYSKAQLLYRWKILKKDYAAYLYLRNKSGWGWDGIYNKPIPPSESAWFELADKYRKYRNNPFLYFGDIQRFLSKDTTKGVHATSSRPRRDNQVMGASTSRPPSSQRELNFDENFDECMPEPDDEVYDSDETTPTPSSRKRSACGGRTNCKKSKSGGSRTQVIHELLEKFFTCPQK